MLLFITFINCSLDFVIWCQLVSKANCSGKACRLLVSRHAAYSLCVGTLTDREYFKTAEFLFLVSEGKKD